MRDMQNKKVYFDHASTTIPKKEVLDFAIEIMKNNWNNPNSIYDRGFNSRNIIDNARKIVAEKINAKPNEIIFCPSASAANTLAIVGYIKANKLSSFAVSSIEHSSILDICIDDVCKNIINCDVCGNIYPKYIDKLKKQLISVGAANSEIGTIQDIQSLSYEAHRNGCVFHSDLTQYIPHFRVDVKDMGLDMATFSAHKFGGLRGCGVLYVKEGIRLSPLIFGHQENGLVGGTENVVSIASLGKAMEMLDYKDNVYLTQLRNYMMQKLIYLNKSIAINGDMIDRIPNNINICIHDLKITSQQIVNICDMYGFEISAGSACNSYSTTPSHVLKAIGLSDDDANHSIRITLSSENTFDEVDDFIKCLKNIIDMNS